MEIKRDASDKHKGITLQKLRAIKLAFELLLMNPNAQLHIAIEIQGDVFIYSESKKFIEENKNYTSKNFSFISHQVANTLVYFLDYWLKETVVERSKNIVFSFYSTNAIAKENLSEKVKALGINLPDRPILELLKDRSFDYSHLLKACKAILLNEYEHQYHEVLAESNYSKIKALRDEDWRQFLSQIYWNFEMDSNEKIKQDINGLIQKYAIQKKIEVEGKEEYIQAMLRQKLEDNQHETDSTRKYITDETIELIFHRVANQPIDKNIYKYIDYDYSELKERVKTFNSSLIKSKYFSLNRRDNLPRFLKRTVKQHNSEIRIRRQDLEKTSLVAIGQLSE